MSSHTILVVEDEEESRQALMQLLELEGFKVVGASNGAEAMDFILDLLMPVMSGRQLRAAL
jgi:CheY-like chemotaxis protein